MMKNSATDETALKGSSATTKPSREGPIIIPLKISPTTAGRRKRSNNSPSKSAAARTIKISVMMLKGSIQFSYNS
jgi:hypothetical protein